MKKIANISNKFERSNLLFLESRVFLLVARTFLELSEIAGHYELSGIKGSVDNK